MESLGLDTGCFFEWVVRKDGTSSLTWPGEKSRDSEGSRRVLAATESDLSSILPAGCECTKRVVTKNGLCEFFWEVRPSPELLREGFAEIVQHESPVEAKALFLIALVNFRIMCENKKRYVCGEWAESDTHKGA